MQFILLQFKLVQIKRIRFLKFQICGTNYLSCKISNMELVALKKRRKTWPVVNVRDLKIRNSSKKTLFMTQMKKPWINRRNSSNEKW